jgi:large repetitive protein
VNAVPPPAPRRHSLSTRLSSATGLAAVVTQVWQAGTSFAIQILAAHLLGAEGLGLVALCLGAIVVGTSVTSGLVGDSLTVLDRRDRRVRAGLEAWTLIATGLTTAVSVAVLWLTGALAGWQLVVFGLAGLAFQVEELLRRLLMANQRFWSLLAVDTTALVGSVAVLVGFGLTGTVTVTTFLVAVVVGQLLGAVVAFARIPAADRHVVPLSGADLRAVGGFGLWRGAQVGITPALLTAARTLVVASTGLAALGALEASRIFVAPAVLAVQGFGSYLLTSYVRDQHLELAALTRRAGRASLSLGAATVLFGGLAALVVPLAGHLVSGPDFEISPWAVLAWTAYSAAVATLQPFASLAAARRRQRAVFVARVVDSGVALGLVALVCLRGLPTALVPIALAVGPLLGGFLVRRFVLRPMLTRTPPPGGPSATGGTRGDVSPTHPQTARSAGPFSTEKAMTQRRVTRFSRPRLLVTGVVTAVVAALAAGGLTAAAAAADPVPPPPATTVTADALPTWQINGVVFSQVVVGTTVYVTGSFTKARPPGVPAGDPSEVDAANIFAFDLTTGQRVASFNHSLNAQGLVVKASPDGSRVYVGGDFSMVDGVSRGHVAAFSTATNALVTTWAPNVGGQVRGFGITADTVYVGGNFPSANAQTRTSLAAFNVTNSQIKPWAPTAEGTGGYVWTMTMTPDSSRVIVGGSFSTLNLQPAYGMGSLDASTGAVMPWAANERIRTAGLNGGITSLRSDGNQIYGSGYAFGTGATFEGTFAADPLTGAINWVNDCLGDEYDTYVLSGAMYSVGHVHDCSVIGQFPDTSPRSRWQKAIAAPITPTGTTGVKDAYGWDFRGLPYAGLLHWYPDLEFGSYTPDRQAAWSITGAGDYLVLGGEFPMVNNVAQQGLVRFALPASSPKASKPIYSTTQTPTASSLESGRVKLRWQTTWDRDDRTLTYDVYRDGGPSIATLTSDSIFWRLPYLSWTDNGLTPGTSHTYKIRARDKDGNVQWSLSSAAVTVSSTGTPTYVSAVRADGASHLWRLGDSGPAFVDSESVADGTATSVTFGVVGAVAGDTAVTSAGGSTPKLPSDAVEAHPSAVTVEAWVNTSTGSGGRIVGFGNSQSGTSQAATNDMVLYLSNAGKVNFSLYNGAWRGVQSTRPVNDGQWHHLVGTADGSGVSLFVDGKRVGRDQSPAVLATFDGYWRLLADQTSGLPNKPTNAALSGAVDEVAVYPTALSQARVQAHYLATGRPATWSTPPTDTYATAVAASGPDSYWRLDETSGATASDSSSSGQAGAYTGVSAYDAAGGVPGGTGRAVTLNGTSGFVVGQESATSPTEYSAEVWFRTNTTRGGRLIGFGNAQSGLSSASGADRQVCMLTDGRLQFGTGVTTLTRALAETTTSYNDNAWHQLVATQSSAGMTLYVDGLPVATNPATGAGAYVGWWRVGGDRCYGGQLSNYPAATFDEAAVYARALTAFDVKTHYRASGRLLPNDPPRASFTSSRSFLAVSVDGSGSSDPDGTVASYAWGWGDGTANGSGATAAHTYATAGTYTVTLTVTDDRGATGTSSTLVTVAANQAPSASFTHAESFMATTVDASASSDPDGTIASYAWGWGDGTANGSGVTAKHTYATEGDHTVTLTVTDDLGKTSTSSAVATTALAPNGLPTASFTSSRSFLSVSVDGSASSDPDGTVASYAWGWGDGTANGSGATATHTYGAAGTYTVTLTVTDDRGGTATSSVPVSVAANQVPAASFTHSESFLVTTVNGSASSDPDGTVASYAWGWGDGSANGSGATTTHTYAAPGAYTVTLTVTDDKGATGTSSTLVTVAANAYLAADDFGRSVANGWGGADTGGAWSIGGLASRWSVSAGLGRLSLNAGDGYTAYLPSVSTSSSDVSVLVTTDKVPTGGGQYVSVVGRRISATNDYRAKVRMASTGAVAVWLTRNEGATEIVLTSLTVPGLSYAAGDRLRIRLQTTAPSPTQTTTMRVKVWKDGATEPVAWTLTGNDSTPAFQALGSVAFYMFLSGSTTNGPVVYGLDEMRVASAQ